MRILHPTDFSQAAELARGLALDLAGRLSASLHLVHVQQRLEAIVSNAFVRTQLELVNETLRQRLEEAREADAREVRERLGRLTEGDATSEVLRGEPLRELLALAPEFDLVVMGAHGQTPFDAAFLGGLAGRLVRRSPVPVMTVRDPCAARRVRRLLVATDFGDASLQAWSFALKLAGRGDLRLVLAHVLEQGGPASGANDRLETLAAGRAERLALRDGNPIEVLPALAVELGADAIVVGLRRHATVTGLLLGSRADALLRSSPVPILSVPAG
jgi:nucleotide-binding universal stress UspA family protein